MGFLENNARIRSLKILLDIYLLLDLVYTSFVLDERGSYYQVWIALVAADLIAAFRSVEIVLDKQQIHSGDFCNPGQLLLIVSEMTN
jgi:hypothetical protein